MALADEILERTDWAKRSKEFGELELSSIGAKFARMSLLSDVPSETWRMWHDLPPDGFVLDPLEQRSGTRWVRYAAIDWAAIPIAGDEITRIATIGYRIAAIFDQVRHRTLDRSMGWLASPRVFLDLESEPRVIFTAASSDRVPPEVMENWPTCDERGVVFVVARALLDLVADRAKLALTPLGQVLEQAISPMSRIRPQTIEDLRSAIRAAGGPKRTPYVLPKRRAWMHVERGIGLWRVGQLGAARFEFDSALRSERGSAFARAARLMISDEVPVRMHEAESLLALPPWPPAARPWPDVELEARELEREHRYADALRLYLSVGSNREPGVAIACARCYLALRDSGHALGELERVSASPEVLQIRTDAWLMRADYPAALVAAEAWLAAAPADARAHHARGKVLLALGRLVEAREAFERACVLDGHLLAALLLRREVDRMLGNVRAQVGTPQPMISEIPPHLAELRDALVTGRLAEGIALLRRDAYARDPVARLLLAQLLATDNQHAAALEAFELAAALPDAHALDAYLGAARAQLALGRAADALALLDQILRDAPDLLEAFDVRATALRALGRIVEADAAHAEYVTRASRRT